VVIGDYNDANRETLQFFLDKTKKDMEDGRAGKGQAHVGVMGIH
jgi:hypothetical protein